MFSTFVFVLLFSFIILLALSVATIGVVMLWNVGVALKTPGVSLYQMRRPPMLVQKVIQSHLTWRTLRLAIWGLVIYLLVGLIYQTVAMYCYPIEVWEYYRSGGLLRLLFGVATWLMGWLTWPFWLALDFAHGVGVFGTGVCASLTTPAPSP